MKLSTPLVGDEEAAAVAAVLGTGFLTQGPQAAEFERLLAEVTGTTFAFAVSSATTGLHLALDAMGVQPGDEVILPDYSFPATANVVVQQGAVPIFVDIDLATYNLDPAALEAAITDRTRVIMPVHAFGLTADMDAINEIAGRHGIPVLEDAACAIAGEYRGRMAGSLGVAGVFSFHPRKIITTGEGGMIMTSDEKLADRIRILRSHGGVRGELYLDFVAAGYNYRLSDIHAAIGVAQMRRLDEILRSRRALAGQMDERLGAIEGVTVPFVPDGTVHTYQSYVVRLDDDIDRDAVIRGLASHDVESTIGTYSMHLQPYFRDRFGVPDDRLPQATTAHRQALTLPLSPQYGEAEIDGITTALTSVLQSSPARPRR